MSAHSSMQWLRLRTVVLVAGVALGALHPVSCGAHAQESGEQPDVESSISSAEALAANGDLQGAREVLEQVLGLPPEVMPMNSKTRVRAWMLLGDLASQLGDYAGAAQALESSRSVLEQDPDGNAQDLAVLMHDIGNNAQRSGDLLKAEKAYERAIELKTDLYGPGASEMANTIISQGVLFYRMGDAVRSRRQYERALEICVPEFGDDHVLTNFARNNLATLLMETGELEAALPLLEQTLESRKRTLGPTHPQVGETIYNLGILHRRLRNTERAAAYYEAALPILEDRYGPAHPHIASVTLSFASLELERGKETSALEKFHLGLEIRANALGADHPRTAKAKLLLAAAYLVTGDNPTALSHAVDATDRVDRYVHETIPWLPERGAILLAANQVHPEHVLVAGILATHGADREAWSRALWNTTLKRRGQVMTEIAGRYRRILEQENRDTRHARAALDTAGIRLSELWVAGPGTDPTAFRAALAEARKRKEQAEAELALASMEFRTARSEEKLRYEDLVTQLGPGQTLVEIIRAVNDPFYWDTDELPHDYALVLEPDGKSTLIDLGLAETIDSAAQIWRQELDESALAMTRTWERDAALVRLDEASKDLRRLVWDPLESVVGGYDTVFLVPEGAFHVIDFAALNRDDGSYLVESGPAVHLLASARDLCRYTSDDNGSRPAVSNMLALGGVDFTASSAPQPELVALATGTNAGLAQYRGPVSTCMQLGAMDWAPLPGTAAEIEDLRAAYADDPDFVALTGPQASEEEFRRQAPGKAILHVATHGFFLDENCGEAEENPLLLSGLVFAGANDPGDRGTAPDGILTAEEIATLDFRSVRLAVLSACDTGRGAISAGEGVLGLRRAFAMAGAQSMVLSLWPMPDEPSREWMAAFYDELRGGSPASVAVRRAKLARLRALRAADLPAHPQLWAGFVHSGDWR